MSRFSWLWPQLFKDGPEEGNLGRRDRRGAPVRVRRSVTGSPAPGAPGPHRTSGVTVSPAQIPDWPPEAGPRAPSRSWSSSALREKKGGRPPVRRVGWGVPALPELEPQGSTGPGTNETIRLRVNRTCVPCPQGAPRDPREVKAGTEDRAPLVPAPSRAILKRGKPRHTNKQVLGRGHTQHTGAPVTWPQRSSHRVPGHSCPPWPRALGAAPGAVRERTRASDRWAAVALTGAARAEAEAETTLGPEC